MNITGYSVKGFIAFCIVVILLFITLLSGEFSRAGWIFLLLIGGMIFYQVIRFAMRSTIGYDPHEGTTCSERTTQKSLEELIRRERKIRAELESIDNPFDQMKFLESLDDPPAGLIRRVQDEIRQRGKKWKCDICKKSFKSEAALNEHKKAKHKRHKANQ